MMTFQELYYEIKNLNDVEGIADIDKEAFYFTIFNVSYVVRRFPTIQTPSTFYYNLYYLKDPNSSLKTTQSIDELWTYIQTTLPKSPITNLSELSKALIRLGANFEIAVISKDMLQFVFFDRLYSLYGRGGRYAFEDSEKYYSLKFIYEELKRRDAIGW